MPGAAHPHVKRLPAAGGPGFLGGKGAGLSRLLDLGAPVPAALVVTVEAFRAHLRQPGPRAALDAASPTDPASAEALRAAITAAPLDPALAAALDAGIRDLGGGPLAVRSSAADEDGTTRSFAGQHDTVLDVAPGPPAHEALRRCWASAFTARSIQYRGKLADVAMAVVVQRLVPADAAGVLFTCDPVSGRADRLVIEAVRGLGETLVSGRATPERIVLGRPGLALLERAGEGEPILDDARARELAHLGSALEGKLGSAPHDFEWALHNEKLHLLQARPVTVKAAGPRIVWANTNAGELLPDVATPMTFSIVNRYVGVLLQPMLAMFGIDLGGSPMLGLVAGRVYFSMNTFVGIMRAIPALGRKSPAELFGGDQAELAAALETLTPSDLPAVRASWLKLAIGAPRLGLWLLRHVNVRGEPFVAALREENERLERRPLRDLDDARLATLLEDLGGNVFGTGDGIACSMVGLGCAQALATLLKKHLGDGDGSLLARLLSGIGGLESAEAGLDLWRLADAGRAPEVAPVLREGLPWAATRARLEATGEGRAFLHTWDSFLARHGHHARGELDVHTPRWREDPDGVLATVRVFLASDAPGPVALHAQRSREREALVAHCRQRLRNPLRRALFDWLLVRAWRGFATRENVKSQAIRRFAVARAALLEAGRRLAERGTLADADDVFFLDLPELLAELESAPLSEVRARVAARRSEWKAHAALRPPSVVIGRYDPALALPEAAFTGDRLTGLAVSPGVVTGRARVILSADAAERVLPGEILVAPFTDPGWTPWFVAAAGVVVDLGGMLSHGSIVAREYGIPAVVNVRHATRSVRTGQLLRVDGNLGEVTILADPAV